VTGAIPPLSADAWLAEFDKYRHTSQYRYLNQGMSLAAFQSIYWWEWTHRLLGRLVGVVFAAPLVVFLVMRRSPRRLIWRCWLLFALGGLQGLVGWWMVKSGLAGRVEVAPERLTVHLGLALLVFCLLIWTALEAWAGPGRPGRGGRWPAFAAGLAGLVVIQILLGGLVAGNNAGLVFNDWPLMNGRLFPADYGEGRGLTALLHSQAAVQFNHRLGAYLLLAAAAAGAVAALRDRELAATVRRLAWVLGGLTVAQAGLGIATLMLRAPLALSLAHQCLAAVVLAAAVTFAWRTRRA
jgi:cytochrome c oxidase assembly protein subunit 15